MEGYYSALESSNDLWYNAADVHLIYSTASEGGGQSLRGTVTGSSILNSVTWYAKCVPCCILLHDVHAMIQSWVVKIMACLWSKFGLLLHM
jgi:hypothetical protein